MTRLLMLGPAAAALAAVALALAAASAVGGARAGGDLSGTWSAAYHMTCDASFVQTGMSVTGDVDCGGDLVVALSGSVEGDGFVLSGDLGLVPLTVAGTLDEGGSISGTFSFAPVVQEGSFTGERLAGSGEGLTGEWTITIADVFAGECVVEIQQTGGDLAAEAACDGQPLGTLTGMFDQGSGELELSGPFGSFTGIEIEATVAAGGGSFTGTWAITPAEAGAPTGVIEGIRLSGPPADDDDGAGDGEGAVATPTLAPAALPGTGSGGGPGSPSVAPAVAIALGLALTCSTLYAAVRPRR